MVTDNNFVRSGRERIADDNYQTVDPRCVHALIQTIPVNLRGDIADCCSPSGSGILDELSKEGYNTYCVDNAFDRFRCDWNIFNPPYERSKVDKIIYKQIENLSSGMTTTGVAALLRTQFDHAKTRKPMFQDNPYYAGHIKMTFRPLWFLDTDITPIHNYVWHIWTKDNFGNPPRVWYW